MTTMTSRRTDKGGAGLGAPLLPQVNLLPPEVRAARGLTATKRVLALILVGVVILAGAGYGVALMSVSGANDELATAQDVTAQLQKETAKYAEVPVVVNGLTRATDARTLGMSTEVGWKAYVDAISAVLPPNVGIQTLGITQATPSVAAPAPASVLLTQGLATITFTATATTLPDASAWVAALDSVPNLYGATFGSEILGEDNGKARYSLTSTVQVASGALASRFPADGKAK